MANLVVVNKPAHSLAPDFGPLGADAYGPIERAEFRANTKKWWQAGLRYGGFEKASLYIRFVSGREEILKDEDAERVWAALAALPHDGVGWKDLP